jgi:hypothetical protein
MTTYLVLSTLMFAFLTFIWSKAGYNFFIKMAFFGLFVYGLVLSLDAFGFILKV